MGHCVGWMELQRLCTLVFISILYLTNDNYYCYNMNTMLLMYQFIIMLSPIYSHFTFGPIEDIRWSNRGNRGHDWTIMGQHIQQKTVSGMRKVFFIPSAVKVCPKEGRKAEDS